VKLYWHLHLYSHFKDWTVNFEIVFLPFDQWVIRGTHYRTYRQQEQRQFGPFKLDWFKRSTRYEQ
jgi:hypothetical protein